MGNSRSTAEGRAAVVERVAPEADQVYNLGAMRVPATGLPTWHYKRYEREQSSEDRLAYARAEETARAERRGLWRDRHPVPPWQFRRD